MDTNNNEREFYTLTDEEGNEFEFELAAIAEFKGSTYYAMIPVEDDDCWFWTSTEPLPPTAK